MIFEIEIKTKKGFSDPHGIHTVSDIEGIGINGIKTAEYIAVYRIAGDITLKQAEIIASELLSDKITEDFCIKEYKTPEQKKIEENSIEVWFKSGVTDTVSESVVKAIKDLGIDEEVVVKTGKKYRLKGELNSNKLKKIATGLLANTLIQEYLIK
ncbi:MAG: phosphoribosylformylglycinamidine synthase subunit PurS [Endomicrobiaceae bacterium]|jgi:phosphoribosylformylglycinamidine synthase|nr:phosphoribosylformylglycinamidine synthase subunit PurS [Endomicrobiaceae bacterium]